MKLDIEEIKKLIPHRDPFLFVDTCEIIYQVNMVNLKNYFQK